MFKNKKCLIRQPAGLGDIFYLQKMACHYYDLGYEIIWPVKEPYLYLKDYLNVGKINFCCEDSDFEFKEIFYTDNFIECDEFLFLPLQKFVMKTKYPSIYMSDDNWQKFVTIERNLAREYKCFKELNNNFDEFIFVNDIFASPPEIIKLNLDIKSKFTSAIYNKSEFINKYNMFDYLSILEKAKEIHTIETSFCYLIEILSTTDKLFMYPRKIDGEKQHSDFKYIEGIYQKRWKHLED